MTATLSVGEGTLTATSGNSGATVVSGSGTSTLTISGRTAPHGTLTMHPDGMVTGRLGGRKVSLRAARAAGAVTRPLPVSLPRYRRLLQLG